MIFSAHFRRCDINFLTSFSLPLKCTFNPFHFTQITERVSLGGWCIEQYFYAVRTWIMMTNETKHWKTFQFELELLLMWCTTHDGLEGPTLAVCWFRFLSPFCLAGACVRTASWWQAITRKMRKRGEERRLIKILIWNFAINKKRREASGKVFLVIWISLDKLMQKNLNNSFQLQQTNFLPGADKTENFST